MSSVAQLEAEIYIGRGVFLKKIINPVFFFGYRKILKMLKIAYYQISSESNKNGVIYGISKWIPKLAKHFSVRCGAAQKNFPPSATALVTYMKGGSQHS